MRFDFVSRVARSLGALPAACLPLVLGLGAALLGAGCQSVDMTEDGSSQAAFVAGEFRMLVNSNAPTTHKATEEAMKQLGYLTVASALREFDAELAARTPLDEKVRVKIREINSRQTQVDIRVDVTGDRALSRKIFDQIEKNLGATGAW
jgi:hypothetical protein